MFVGRYPTGGKFPLEFKFSYIANGKFTKLKFCLLLYFKNRFLIAYVIEIQKSKFAYIQFRELNQSDPSR